MAPAKNRPAKLIQAFVLPGDDASTGYLTQISTAYII